MKTWIFEHAQKVDLTFEAILCILKAAACTHVICRQCAMSGQAVNAVATQGPCFEQYASPCVAEVIRLLDSTGVLSLALCSLIKLPSSAPAQPKDSGMDFVTGLNLKSRISGEP